MQAIYFEAPGRLSRREVDPPTLSRPSAALVRPLVVATCDLDTAMLRGAIPSGPVCLWARSRRTDHRHR